MMAGAVSALSAAGCALVGGHSSEGPEPALGFSVTGAAMQTLLILSCMVHIAPWGSRGAAAVRLCVHCCTVDQAWCTDHAWCTVQAWPARRSCCGRGASRRGRRCC